MLVKMINKEGNAILTATTASRRMELENLGFTVVAEPKKSDPEPSGKSDPEPSGKSDPEPSGKSDPEPSGKSDPEPSAKKK